MIIQITFTKEGRYLRIGISQETKDRGPPGDGKDGVTRVDDAYAHSELWYQWVVEAYPQVLPKRVKQTLTGIRLL